MENEIKRGREEDKDRERSWQEIKVNRGEYKRAIYLQACDNYPYGICQEHINTPTRKIIKQTESQTTEVFYTISNSINLIGS